jgi:alpha-beta hydrolase superfamily lysophospholipase
MGWLIGAGVALAGLYVAVAFLARWMEPTMLFPAPPVSRDALQLAAKEVGAHERTVVTSDGLPLYGWRRGSSDRLVVLFSGNGATVGGYPARAERLLDAGFEVLHVNYRGYPGSSGTPSEAGLLLDAQAVWEEALRTHSPERIVVYGKSLGGGVAVGLVSQLDAPPALLLLESTFTSAADIARRRFPFLPVRALMRSPFDSMARAPDIACPTLVLHGNQDRVIPASHGSALAARIPDAQHLELPGTHPSFLLDQEPAWALFERALESVDLHP